MTSNSSNSTLQLNSDHSNSKNNNNNNNTDSKTVTTNNTTTNNTDSKLNNTATSSACLLLHFPGNISVSYSIHGLNEAYTTTIIFLPGAGNGRLSIPYLSNNYLINNNIRLIIFDRIGYGQSSSISNFTLLSYANQLKSYCDALNISNCYWIAHSAGAPYLLAFASQYSQYIIRFSLVCPPNPISISDSYQRPIEPSYTRKFQSWLIRKFPNFLYKLFIQLASKFANNSQEWIKFLETESNKSKLDKKWFNSTIKSNNTASKYYRDIFSASISTIEHAKSMATDMILSSKSWEFAINSINNIDIDIWYGLADTTAPNGEWLYQQLKLNNNNIKNYPMIGYGHCLIYAKFNEIINKLINPPLLAPAASAIITDTPAAAI